MLQGVGGVVQIWRTKTGDGRERYASQCVKSDNVAIDFLVGWRTDMGHAAKKSLGRIGRVEGDGRGTNVWSAISLPTTYQSVTRV